MPDPDSSAPTEPTALPGRPRLKPGLRRVWRDLTTLQLGLDPDRAVAVADLDPPTARFLARLDGATAAPELVELATALGSDPHESLALVARLDRHDLLEDAAAPTPTIRALGREERDRIAVDLAAWSLTGRRSGTDVHADRRRRRVDVFGAGRIGALAAALLAHAGVGEIHVHDPAPLRACDVPAPWARSVPTDAAAPPRREDVALDVCEQLAPSLATSRRRPRGFERRAAPDVALLAPVDSLGTVDLELRDALMRAAIPHLPVFVRETVGVVGPFVDPGRTSCLRCQDLLRTDRDPAWPRMLAQLGPPLRRGSAGPVDAGDGVLATTVAAQAVLQVLTLLDGGSPRAFGASIETSMDDGITQVRPWSRHPACGCAWA